MSFPENPGIEQILSSIRRPSRYIGSETNAGWKAWEDARLRTCLVFPDLYEIGMSHLGLHILYHILNGIPWSLADRAYCPDTDMEDLLRNRKMPLWGLESGKPLLSFDILAITIPYELCSSNILTILDLAGIPLLARQRTDPSFPLVIGGGSASANPEPVAGIFDAILIGDGEDAVVEIAKTVSDWRESSGARQEVLAALARIPGVYVPSLHRPAYGPDGSFLGMEGGGKVRRRIVPDLEAAPVPTHPLVPFVQTVHNRLGVEIARGCTRGCRFCQAGIFYRPVRERPPGQILDLVECGLSRSGWEEVSLLSLSTGDYPSLEPLIATIMERHAQDHISVSLPSLRVGTLTPGIMDLVGRGRKTGFTLAPEAGSERLRRVINKGITEEALLETAAGVFRAGWPGIKLYFMIGLPTETREDILAISGLARKVRNTGGRGKTVTVSVGTFVPKPHTPFQWEGQIPAAEARERIDLLRSSLRERSIRFKWHDPEMSRIEGIFSRGDRRLLSVLMDAWRRGARLDAWTDHARPGLYHDAGKAVGLDLDTYLGPRDPDAPLPWDHIDSGVKRTFLLAERERAWKGVSTPDCRKGDCQGCGVCDMKTVRPITHPAPEVAPPVRTGKAGNGHAAGRFTYRLAFSKLGLARFLGHLETMNAIHRAARRAGLPVAFSGGHHPHPRCSFGPPIPLFTESLCEIMEVTLTMPWEPQGILTALNAELPGGLRIIEACVVTSPNMEQTGKQGYLLATNLPEPMLAGAVRAFGEALHVPHALERKGSTMDLRQAVSKVGLLSCEDFMNDQGVSSWIRDAGPCSRILLLVMKEPAGAPAPRPSEVMEGILRLIGEPLPPLRILKIPLAE